MRTTPGTIAAALILFVASLTVQGHALAADPPGETRLAAPRRFARGVVASDSALASEIGKRVLERGGNAVDAAVATAFALAVVFPEAGNVGGGGFLVARRPDGTSFAFDFREKAPLAASPGMFLDTEGKHSEERQHWSILSVGVPGTVAGLHLAHSRLGKMPWKDLVEPAVALARQGFRVGPGLAASLADVFPALRRHPASQAVFTRGGEPLREGDTLIQEDLARTLERIRDGGAEGFYRGETADLLVKEMERRGGLITREDLLRYRAVERKPLSGTYRGFEVITMPPPSSGGVALLTMLNILEGFDLRAMGPRGSKEGHVLIEAMRRAYAERARHLGDPDLVEVPVSRLVSKEHAAELRRSIDLRRASVSAPESFQWPAEGTHTTHLSAVDGERMAVALTTTLEQAYGSRMVVPGAGFLLNNEMGDFNAREGLTDREGRIGTPANLAAPGKRMLSSMTPTIVARDGKPWLVLGSPGGRTIINTVLLVLVNAIDHRMAVQDAIDAPRFHHPWLPDRVRAEPWCFSPDARAALEAMGHRIEEARGAQGSVMAVRILEEKKGLEGGAGLEAGVDRRRADGGAAGW